MTHEACQSRAGSYRLVGLIICCLLFAPLWEDSSVRAEMVAALHECVHTCVCVHMRVKWLREVLEVF